MEDGVPNIGDCFGAGCNDSTENLVGSKSDGFEIGLVEIMMIISAIGVIGLSVSIIRENKQTEQKWSSNKSIWDQSSEE